MSEYLAERTLANMRFGLSITRPGFAFSVKMALEMGVKALEKQIPSQLVNDGAFGKCPDCEFGTSERVQFEILPELWEED